MDTLSEFVEFKVGKATSVKNLGAAIAANITANKKLFLSSIAPGALNQAIKAVVVANQRLVGSGITLTISPAFHKNEATSTVTLDELVEQTDEELLHSQTVMRLFLCVKHGG